MKHFFFLLFLLICSSIIAQNEPYGGGEYLFPSQECISQEKYEEIRQQLIANMKKMGLYEVPVENREVVSLIWPLRRAQGYDVPGVDAVSNYVDHNSGFSGSHNNLVQDYNCGNRSYDTEAGYNHRGTDIYTWPFPWYKMDENLVEVVAAAAGTIIDKRDGNYDRNCQWCTNCNWNAVYVRHSDGSVVFYGHLKNGSLTEKEVGEAVSQGEYLGIVGSSGVSSGPHLHFELWETPSLANLIDPYSGNCNPSTGESWWVDQESYRVSRINQIMTGDDPPTPVGCGQPWIQNEESQFFANDMIYLSAYYRDQISGTFAEYRIRQPDGVVFNSWTQNFTSTFSSSWWWWSRTLPPDAPAGTWTYEVTYKDHTEILPFRVRLNTSLHGEETNDAGISIMPSPFSDQFVIFGNFEQSVEFEIHSLLGQKMVSGNLISGDALKVNTENWVSGAYLAQIKATDRKHSKIIVKN